MREKKRDEKFAWDFINMGITRKFLERAYFENFKEVKDLDRCQDSCEKCGGCTKLSKEYFKKSWDNTLPPDRNDVLELLEKRFVKQTVQRLRFKIFVNEPYRFVHASKIKNYIRRALMRANLPIRSDLTLASDKLKFNNWSYGFDYGEISLYSKYFMAPKELIAILNSTFDDVQPLSFVDANYYSEDASSFCGAYSDIIYGFLIPKADRPYGEIKAALEKANSAEELVVRLKVLGKAQGSTVTINFNARECVKDLWCKETAKGTAVYARMLDVVGPYELFPSLFKTSKRNVLRYPVKRVEFLMPRNEGALDMFSDLCEECGTEIEENVFGDKVHDKFCVKHSILNK